MDKILITMDHLKECVGSHRYQAKDTPVHTLYIQKTALPNGKAPKRIAVLIQDAD
jgi:hypothetical protein